MTAMSRLPEPRPGVEYRLGQRLERTDGDDLLIAVVELWSEKSISEGATVLLPPRWASDRLVEVLSWRAEAMVGGTCPRCRASAFVPDDRDQLLPAVAPPGAQLGPHEMLVHKPGCPVDDRVVTALLREEVPR